MLERERLLSKKVSKTQSVTSQIDQGISTDSVHIGPSDHVPWLNDRKWAYIRLEGRNFGDVPLNVELKLEVWDSPNSAGVIIDAVRCCKLALDRGIGGPLLGLGVLHEVAAGAVPRRRGPPHGRGVRRPASSPTPAHDATKGRPQGAPRCVLRRSADRELSAHAEHGVRLAGALGSADRALRDEAHGDVLARFEDARSRSRSPAAATPRSRT